MKNILFIIYVVLLTGCSQRYSRSRECSYTHKKIYNTVNIGFDFDTVWNQSKLNSIQSKPQNTETIKIIYKTKDESLDTSYWLTILIMMDNENCYLSSNRNDEKIGSITKIDSKSHSFKKLAKYINSLPNEYFDRDCLVSDGINAVCVVKKGNEFYNSFVSYGYDCWIGDSSMKPEKYLNIFKLVNKLNKFSKF